MDMNKIFHSVGTTRLAMTFPNAAIPTYTEPIIHTSTSLRAYTFAPQPCLNIYPAIQVGSKHG